MWIAYLCWFLFFLNAFWISSNGDVLSPLLLPKYLVWVQGGGAPRSLKPLLFGSCVVPSLSCSPLPTWVMKAWGGLNWHMDPGLCHDWQFFRLLMGMCSVRAAVGWVTPLGRSSLHPADLLPDLQWTSYLNLCMQISGEIRMLIVSSCFPGK